MALLSLGAIDVPRGTDSMSSEIRFIIEFAECKYGIFANIRQLEKVLENLSSVPLFKTAILFDSPSKQEHDTITAQGITLFSFTEIMTQGKKIGLQNAFLIEQEMEQTETHAVATIIFTSGTTGVPKGVMLTHRNYIAQLEVVHHVLTVKEGDMWLSVLPVWHSFERVMQYIALTLKSGIAYSKPIASVMMPDFLNIRPQWMCAVPRLWESLAQGIYRTMRKKGGISLSVFLFFIAIGKRYTWAKEYITGKVPRFRRRLRIIDFLLGIIPAIILFPLYMLGEILVYKKIREQLGGQITAVISGGGALQDETDAFYRAINLKLLEGYGITEAGPILSVRDCKNPRPNCVGVIYPSSSIKIVKEENGIALNDTPLKPGKQGLIYARGEQIMKGYYKQAELTKATIDSYGWLNTGDLGMLTYDNEIKITGRAKDTIVLSGGENIEPLVIENALCGSKYIETAMVVGQDKRYLAALIIPLQSEITTFAHINHIKYIHYSELLEDDIIQELMSEEIKKRVTSTTGFRLCERIVRFTLLPKSFTIGKELSAKQELVRHKINAIYSTEIEQLFVD